MAVNLLWILFLPFSWGQVPASDTYVGFRQSPKSAFYYSTSLDSFLKCKVPVGSLTKMKDYDKESKVYTLAYSGGLNCEGATIQSPEIKVPVIDSEKDFFLEKKISSSEEMRAFRKTLRDYRVQASSGGVKGPASAMPTPTKGASKATATESVMETASALPETKGIGKVTPAAESKQDNPVQASDSTNTTPAVERPKTVARITAKSGLNVRKGGATLGEIRKSPVVSSVKFGSSLELTGEKRGNWVQVRLPDGQLGWASQGTRGQLLDIQEPTTTEVKGQAFSGTRPMKRPSQVQETQVAKTSGSSEQSVQGGDSVESSEAASDQAVAEKDESKRYARITLNGGRLNARSGASTGTRVVGKLKGGDVVELLDEEPQGNWRRVRLANGEKAWVSQGARGQYMDILQDGDERGLAQSGASGAVTTSASSKSQETDKYLIVTTADSGLYLRDRSSTGGEILDTLPRGAIVERMGASVSGWTKVKYGDKIGYAKEIGRTGLHGRYMNAISTEDAERLQEGQKLQSFSTADGQIDQFWVDDEREVCTSEPRTFENQLRDLAVLTNKMGSIPVFGGATKYSKGRGNSKIYRVDNCRAHREGKIAFTTYLKVGQPISCKSNVYKVSDKLKSFLEKNLEACTGESLSAMSGDENQGKPIAQIVINGQGTHVPKKSCGSAWSQHTWGHAIDINSLTVKFADGSTGEYPTSPRKVTRGGLAASRSGYFPGYKKRSGYSKSKGRWEKSGKARFQTGFRKCMDKAIAAEKRGGNCSGGILDCDHHRSGTAGNHNNHLHLSAPACPAPANSCSQ